MKNTSDEFSLLDSTSKVEAAVTKLGTCGNWPLNRNLIINIYTVPVGTKRKRCGSCESCQSKDCGLCVYCLDKPKFGGPNLLKQSCLKRKCTCTAESVRLEFYASVFLNLANSKYWSGRVGVASPKNDKSTKVCKHSYYKMTFYY